MRILLLASVCIAVVFAATSRPPPTGRSTVREVPPFTIARGVTENSNGETCVTQWTDDEADGNAYDANATVVQTVCLIDVTRA